MASDRRKPLMAYGRSQMSLPRQWRQGVGQIGGGRAVRGRLRKPVVLFPTWGKKPSPSPTPSIPSSVLVSVCYYVFWICERGMAACALSPFPTMSPLQMPTIPAVWGRKTLFSLPTLRLIERKDRQVDGGGEKGSDIGMCEEASEVRHSKPVLGHLVQMREEEGESLNCEERGRTYYCENTYNRRLLLLDNKNKKEENEKKSKLAGKGEEIFYASSLLHFILLA